MQQVSSEAPLVHVPSGKGTQCLRLDVPQDACYVAFGIGVVARVMLLQSETVRGETLAVDLNKDGQVMGIELIQPGTKPCQPAWHHTNEQPTTKGDNKQ